MPRIGYLSVATAERDKEWLNAFRQGLKELGYVEGRNIAVDVRHAAGYPDRLERLAAELVQNKIDVFVAYGRPAVKAAQSASGKIPIVMTVSGDPVQEGLAKSMAHPGGQVTGLSDLHSGLASKRLQMLKEIMPLVTKVAVIINPAATQLKPQLDDLKKAAASLGITLIMIPIKSPASDEIKHAYAALGGDRPGALMVVPDGTIDRASVAAFAIEHRLPSIGTVKEWAEAGFFMSYGTSFADLWRRSATYVDKIIKGAKPGDLPIEQPTKFELVINMKTAKLLGLKIPKSILVQADKVIE
jgi:putative ABC transport system substrate-binding protein